MSNAVFWGRCPKRAKERNFNIPLFLYAKIKRKRGAGFPAPFGTAHTIPKCFAPNEYMSELSQSRLLLIERKFVYVFIIAAYCHIKGKVCKIINTAPLSTAVLFRRRFLFCASSISMASSSLTEYLFSASILTMVSYLSWPLPKG